MASPTPREIAMEARKREFDAKRRAANRQSRANLLGMASNPGALLRGALDIPGSVYRYVRDNEPVEIGEDVSGFASDMAGDFRKDPVKFAVDMVNPMSSVQGFADIRAQARDLRAAGDLDNASMLEQIAAMSPLSVLPVVGKVLGKGAKAAAKAATKKAASFAVRESDGKLQITPVAAAPQIVPEARGADIDTLRTILSDPAKNQAQRVAKAYTQKALGKDYEVAKAPVSSLEKQSGIARVYEKALENDPAYEHAVFEQYGRMFPQMVEQSGAKNYGQLAEKSYLTLGDELSRQFEQVPVTTVFHSGDLEYATPSAMLRDVLGEGKLNVFRGGEPASFMTAVDPETGLSINEKFRAVHDYFGHVPSGSTFRPSGEEAAYASHAQMLSPLAQAALLTETRGQNSFVNYSPVNAKIIGRMEDVKASISTVKAAKRDLETYPSYHYKHSAAKKVLDNTPDLSVLNKELRILGQQMQFAKQKPVLLPPQYLAADTAGGIPDFVKSLIVPKTGTTASGRGVHMGTPGLDLVDPRFFGTGHRGVEYPAVISGEKGAPKRSYFYVGEPGTVNPEQVLFARGERVPYEAMLNSLYDLNADPVGLKTLAMAYSREGFPTNQLDRLVREYGYKGSVGGGGPEWEAGQTPAMVFEPTPVVRLPVKPGHKGYTHGGRVSPLAVKRK